MKTLILLTSLTVVAACSSTSVVEEHSNVQSYEEAQITLGAHVEKSNMNRNFCDGNGFSFYSENRYSYTFRCKSKIDVNGNYKEGGYFHLVK